MTNLLTGPQPVAYAEAATITAEQVRESIAAAREHGARFFDQIVWQVENETWTVLGYGSWDEMREAEYADLGVVAPRADRPELVARLRAKGLTQQSIASTLGTTRRRVHEELSRGGTPIEAPVTNSRGQQRPATYLRRAPVAPRVPEPVDDAAVAALVAARGEKPTLHTLDWRSWVDNSAEAAESELAEIRDVVSRDLLPRDAYAAVAERAQRIADAALALVAEVSR